MNVLLHNLIFCVSNFITLIHTLFYPRGYLLNLVGILAQKSRDLLVNLLRIISGIFSESTCSDLLALPKLVEYSTSLGSKTFPDMAHKANDLLKSLADIFSTAAFEQTTDGKFSYDRSVVIIITYYNVTRVIMYSI